MPSYELAVILRKMSRPETATVLKRVATQIYENKGLLFGIENLGQRKLPYRIRNHGNWNDEGRYEKDKCLALLRVAIQGYNKL